MSAALIQMGLRSPIGRQLVGALATEAVIPLVKIGIEKGSPVVVKGVKAGVSVMKDYGTKACRKVARRYREPNRSFVVNEQTNVKSGHRVISVSSDFDEGFLQAMYYQA